VRGLRCLADHRPERAWHLCGPGETGDIVSASLQQGESQPSWLLPQPRPLREHQGVPQYGGALRLKGLPERIEAGWWDGFDITRDYFVAYSPAGERLWVFRDRRSGSWYLHGLFM
jgi:protein ImuB